MVEKVRVLIVDDSSFFRNRIRQELERTGEVQVAGEAANGAEAVRLAASLRPDLITMDVAMPVMDGIALALNVARERPDLPIMLMTGYAHQRERAHGLDSLIRDVVQKPFTLAEICSRVRNALDGDGDARRASA